MIVLFVLQDLNRKAIKNKLTVDIFYFYFFQTYSSRLISVCYALSFLFALPLIVAQFPGFGREYRIKKRRKPTDILGVFY